MEHLSPREKTSFIVGSFTSKEKEQIGVQPTLRRYNVPDTTNPIKTTESPLEGPSTDGVDHYRSFEFYTLQIVNSKSKTWNLHSDYSFLS